MVTLLVFLKNQKRTIKLSELSNYQKWSNASDNEFISGFIFFPFKISLKQSIILIH